MTKTLRLNISNLNNISNLSNILSLNIYLVRYALFLILVFFSVNISELSLAKIPLLPATQEVVQEPQKARAIKRKTSKLVLEKLDELDREAFLASFERQAKESLIACLRSTMKSGSLVLSGVLTRSGHFRRLIHLGDQAEELPDCTRFAIFKMDFSKLTQKFHAESLEIQWRIDF